jgi:hypothetical protein
MSEERGRFRTVSPAWLAPAFCLALLPAVQAAPAAGDKKAQPAPEWTIDSDGDRVPDLVEAFYRTSASDPAERPQGDLRDTDRDGVPDAVERAHGKNPLDPASFPVPVLPDSDGDATPDINEILAGRDPLAADRPAPEVEPAFVTGACRGGFIPARAGGANRLCIRSLALSAWRYDDAAADCQNRESRLCSYEDLFYFYRFGAGVVSHNPLGAWIGNMTGDGEVLCGNRAITGDGDGDRFDFEGTCGKAAGDPRQYWCCHDLDP